MKWGLEESPGGGEDVRVAVAVIIGIIVSRGIERGVDKEGGKREIVIRIQRWERVPVAPSKSTNRQQNLNPIRIDNDDSF